MKNILSVIFSFLLFVSCNYSSNRKDQPVLYQKNGLSIQLPNKYWKVIKDRPIDGIKGTRIISIDNQEPLSKDGYLVLTEINKNLNLSSFLEKTIRSYRSIYRQKKIAFGLLDTARNIKVGNKEALRVGFETSVIANRNIGSIALFKLKDKTYSFIFMGEAKEAKNYHKLLDSMISSFKVN
ncbi:hypothetical protein SAMN05421827_104186 [Pedobacter terrae]|uniref:PsbP C-terminal domain-containing protein n=1 Tax=Pedobacter terrae TaxID=405671 RepID=A0A1G7SHS0_9SPHI|nr:hypothetical protein [Pedobacter terrae]SDG22491.1 hypothetical protein SAMN05421827_104186 [Pedobacter terrae]